MNAARIFMLACVTCVGSAIAINSAPAGEESPATSSGLAVASTAVALPSARAGQGRDVQLDISRIYWEYNSSANDLGVHVFLDGEDWKWLKISKPNERVLFAVAGFGPYKQLGMTELFFEGAEPSLEDVPLEALLAAFPEGVYEFEGRTVDDVEIEGEAEFSHAIPDGPQVRAIVGPNDFLRIRWTPVDTPPPGFPDLPVNVVAYQVIVESFQVTVPAGVDGMTVPREFVASLAHGEHQFEVLAIEESGNQTITEGSFTL
jgi:hypothetical protein